MGKYKGFAGSGMNANKNVNNVIRQAQKMQEEMEKVQEDMQTKTVEASSGGGMVTVVATGGKQIESIKINKDVVDPEDVETLEDLILVAVNDAINKADDMMTEGMSAITGGLKIPGLF